MSQVPFILRPGFLTYVAPAAVYVVAVFYLGSIAVGPHPHSRFFAQDKLLHAIAFGGMQVVFFRAVFWWGAGRRLLGLLAASALGAILVGGLLELYQAALPHRTAEFLDWVADALGVLLVAGVQGLVRRARSGSGE